MADGEPSQLTPYDEEPMWESDVEEREAKKRRMMFFGGSAVAVLVGFVGLYAALSWVAGGLTSDPDPAPLPGTATVGSDEVPGDVGAPPPAIDVADVAGAEDLEWYAIEAPLAFAERLYTSEAGAFYALSTVPGFVNTWPIPKAIYKSLDGENWDMIALDETISGNDMAGWGNSLYLIGTAPSNQNIVEKPEVLVSATSDDGETWTQTLLPTIADKPAAATIEWANVTTRIAAGADTIIAAVHSQFFLDYRQMVPPDFRGNDYGYNPTADGVNVIDYRAMEEAHMRCENEMGRADGEEDELSDECRALLMEGDESIGAIGFVTWEEMGLEAGGEPVFAELFISSDGETFESIDSPFEPGSDLQSLYGTPGGYVAIEWSGRGQRLWTSPDGRTWESNADLDEFDWITNAGAIDGRTVMIGQTRNGAGVAWQNEAGGWDVIDLSSVLGPAPAEGRWASSGAVGPMGVVLVLQSWDELTQRESAQVVFGTDSETWSVIPVEEVTGMTGGYSSWAAVGADRILVHYQAMNLGRGEPLNLQVMGVATS